MDVPLYFPIQSLLNAASSSGRVFDGERVDKMEDGARKLEKCARSSFVTEFRFDDRAVEAHLWRSELEGVLHTGARTRTFRRATAESMIDLGGDARSTVGLTP